MSNDKLREKITSKDQLITVLAEIRNTLNSAAHYRAYAESYANSFSLNHENVDWWAVREFARLQYGIYELTDALRKVRQFTYNLHAHVSLEDPKMIAYTPDKQSGEADRQIRIAPGRFFSRFLPIMTENFIRQLTEEHIAELSDEVEFVEGEQIVDEYINFPAGVGACMTKECFSKANHPAWVYVTEKVKLALVRDSGGKVISRSLVYEPSEDDKRYIRASYGSPVLEKRLKRKGYKAGTFVGAKLNLKTCDEPDEGTGKVTFLLPYIDGNGQAGSERWSYVAILDGELQVISLDMLNKLRALDPAYVASGINTSGKAKVRPVDTASFQTSCVITGKPINLLTADNDAVVKVLVKPDIVEHALSAELYSTDITNWRRMWLEDKYIYVHPDQLLVVENTTYPNHRGALMANGLSKLDEVFYPEMQGWHRGLEVVFTSDNRAVLSKDAARIVRKDAVGGLEVVTMHKSELPEKAVKVHSPRIGAQNYVAADVPVQKTISGRKVHEMVNNIAKLITGELEFTNKIQVVDFWGAHMNVQKTQVHRIHEVDEATLDAMWSRVTLGRNDACESITYALGRLLRGTVVSDIPFYRDPSGFAAHAERQPLPTLVSYCRKAAQTIERNYPTNTQKLIARMLKKCPEMALAEAEAVEAPHRLVEAVPTIETPEIEIISTQQAETV